MNVRTGDVVLDEIGRPLKLGEPLGEGGQGQVWSTTDGRMAVKFLNTSGPDAAQYLRTRLATVRRFDLSGIPIAMPREMLGNGHVGYVMELLSDLCGIGLLGAVPSNVQIGEWHRRSGGLRRRLRVLGLAADALHLLHSRAIAYGDVSPTNILVSKSSQYHQVWFIDPDNLAVASDAGGQPVYSPGYGAPEVVRREHGCDSLTDAFSFAVLAFQLLTLQHPFHGEEVEHDPNRKQLANAGRLPWIDHPTDDSNRSRAGLPRKLVLTKGLAALCRQTFEDGLADAGARPGMREWRTKLHQAAQSTITCPGCRATYYPIDPACPWCGAARPALVRCDVHAWLPPQPVPAALTEQSETDRLESILLTESEPAVIRARNALISLDRGPSTGPVDADEPVAELRWDSEGAVQVSRVGRHDVWLHDSVGNTSVRLPVGTTRLVVLAGNGFHTVHFGPLGQIHRFVRFAVSGRVAR